MDDSTSPDAATSDHAATWKSSIGRTDAIPGLVSVIVPVYNRSQIIGQALDSILGQTYRPMEIIVVDDGSTDDSRQVLEAYRRQYPTVVKVVHQQNSGPAIARNAGILQSRGQFVAFLDSDDLWLPGKLERQIPLLVGSVGLVYSAIEEFGQSGETLRTVPCEERMRGNIYHHLLARNRITGGTVLTSREVLETVGLFDERLRAAENWDLWIRISRHFEVDFVNEPLTRYRKHTQSLSFDRPRMREATIAVLEKHFPEPPELEDPRREIYDAAFANFYHRWGIQLFTEGDYRGCREKFRRCWSHIPGYADSRGRYLRSFLPRPINSWLSGLRELLP